MKRYERRAVVGYACGMLSGAVAWGFDGAPAFIVGVVFAVVGANLTGGAIEAAAGRQGGER